MKPAILIITIFTAIILFSCEKKEPEIVYYFDDSLSVDLYPMLFSEGSQWIYQDSASNMFDTVTVLSVKKDTALYVTTGLEYSSVCYKTELNSSISGAFNWFYIGYIISVNDESHDYIYLAGKKKNDSVLNAVLEKVLDTLKVGNTKYPDVVKMRIKPHALIRQPMNLYFADSIGIVRKEIHTNSDPVEIWNLVSKNVSCFSK